MMTSSTNGQNSNFSNKRKMRYRGGHNINQNIITNPAPTIWSLGSTANTDIMFLTGQLWWMSLQSSICSAAPGSIEKILQQNGIALNIFQVFCSCFDPMTIGKDV